MASNFPLRAPIGLIAGVLLAGISIIPIMAVWLGLQPPVERFYVGQYVVTSISSTPIGTVATFFKGSQDHKYHVLVQNGHPVSGPVAETRLLSVRVVHGENPTAFHAWLRVNVYHGRDLSDLFRPPLEVWCAVALCSFVLGAVLDFRRRKSAREGIQLRGGEMLTVDEFNSVTKGDGFGLYVKK
jgi:hypothetical protein